MTTRRALALALALLACHGCSRSKPGPVDDPIRTAIAGVDLRDRSLRAIETTGLYDQIDRMIGDGRERTARLLILARPGEARRCILERRVADPAVLLMAATLDRIGGSGDQRGDGWAAYVRHRTITPDAYRDWEDAIDGIGRAVREGRWGDAADALPLRAPRAPGGDLLAIESARVAAVVHLANRQYDEARSAILAAIPLMRVLPGDAIDLPLLLSECDQRKSSQDLIPSWQRAAQAGIQPTAITDPDWLRRLIDARPRSAPFPEAFSAEVRHRLVAAYGSTIATIPVESGINAWIGSLLLDRGDADAALLAWSQAMDACPDPVLAVPLRIGQARALAQLRRYGEAQGLLDATSLNAGAWDALLKDMSLVLAIKRGEPPTRVEAEVPSIGALQGSVLLHAVADRASALHALGQTEDALRLLKQLKNAGTAQGDGLFLSQCLQMELAWISSLGDDKRVDVARQQIDAWESNPGP